MIAIVPRILIGLTPYFVYKLLKGRAGLIFAGALGSLTNTVFVLGGIFFLFGNVFDGNIQKLLATVISTNSIAELIISALLTLVIVPRLEKLNNKNCIKRYSFFNYYWAKRASSKIFSIFVVSKSIATVLVTPSGITISA